MRPVNRDGPAAAGRESLTKPCPEPLRAGFDGRPRVCPLPFKKARAGQRGGPGRDDCHRTAGWRGPGSSNRDWIVVTRQDGDRQLRLAITTDNLPEVWQALAGTGVTLSPAAGELEQAAKSALGRVTGWRRVALGFGLAVVFAFAPALVDFIARHLR
jgi:hypothetical protein